MYAYISIYNVACILSSQLHLGQRHPKKLPSHHPIDPGSVGPRAVPPCLAHFGRLHGERWTTGLWSWSRWANPRDFGESFSVDFWICP